MAGSDTKVEKKALLEKIGEIEKKHKWRKIIKKPPMITQVTAEPLPAKGPTMSATKDCSMLELSHTRALA